MLFDDTRKEGTLLTFYFRKNGARQIYRTFNPSVKVQPGLSRKSMAFHFAIEINPQ